MADLRLHLEVCSDPRMLGLIRTVIRGWLEAFDLARERRHEVILAVDEACSNAMRHAYGGRCDEAVEVTLSASGEWVDIRVSDRGVPCPAERAHRRTWVPPSRDELQPGGLGLKLIREVFDEVQFRPGEERGNCIIMRLRRAGKREVSGED